MKLLLDQHLSRKLVPQLQQAFPGSSHVVLEGLEGGSDDAIWLHARAGGFTLVTKDEDFQIMSFSRGFPPKVIWLRSGNGPSKGVLDVLLKARPIIEHFLADADRSLLSLP